MLVLLKSNSIKKITGIACFLIVSILVSTSLYYYGQYTFDNSYHYNPPYPIIYFSIDDKNRTLSVTEVQCNKIINWNDVILLGNATLPSGIIDIGDVITNCSGSVCLAWDPTGSVLGNWDF